MGLGLYIVKTIIHLHGGEITVSSIVDQYTQFSFWIPKKPEPQNPRDASGSNQKSGIKSGSGQKRTSSKKKKHRSGSQKKRPSPAQHQSSESLPPGKE